MKLPKFVAAIFLVLLNGGGVQAQSNPPQNAPLSPEQTQTASIYITASTKKGILIRDLKPEDITITEDNVPAKIEKLACHDLEPLLVGILVDVSGSRRSDSHLHSHYDDLEGFLNRLLTKNDGAYLVAYDDDVHKLSELVNDPPGISAAFDKLRNLEPRGSTALYDAITSAAGANLKSRSGRRVLIVMGDWEDNSSHTRMVDVPPAAQRTSTSIYAILDADNGIEGKRSYDRAVKAATEITEQTGGRAYEVHGKNDLVKILQAIGGAALGACKVTYTNPENPDTKKGVKLHVQANSKDVSVLYPSVRFTSVP